MERILFTMLLVIFLGQLSAQERTMGLVHYNSEASDGLTLFAPKNSTSTYLIDECGELINKWTSNFSPGNVVYLLDQGHLLRAGNIGNEQNPVIGAGGSGGILEIKDWEDNLLWQYEVSDSFELAHHDVQVLPNGNILVLAWDRRLYDECILAGRDSVKLADSVVWSEKIIEIKPIFPDSAVVVWEWYLWDHLIQDFDSSKNNYGIVADNQHKVNINYVDPLSSIAGRADWIHANAINYNADLDQIILSSRNTDEVWIIDHATTTEEARGIRGDLLYRWGNPHAYERGTKDEQELFGQHNPTFIYNDSIERYQVLVFNNGRGREEKKSSVEIFDLPMDKNGAYDLNTSGQFLPDDIFWSYDGGEENKFYSPGLSGAQKLSNGNVLICNASQGSFFEINKYKEIVWKYVNPVVNDVGVDQSTIYTDNPNGNNWPNFLFRAEKYKKENSLFEGLDLSAMGPLENNAFSKSLCDSLISDIEINDNRALFKKHIIDHTLFIRSVQPSEKYFVQVYGLDARLVYKSSSLVGDEQIDLSGLCSGLYILGIETEHHFETKKIWIR